MTPVVRWLKNWAEKFAKRYYEGPEPPERLHTEIKAFAKMYPHATRAEWVEFATAHSGGAYEEGYVRGFEYVERDREAWYPDVDPEVIADAVDPGWRWGEPFSVLDDPDKQVPEEFDAVGALREQMDRLARRHKERDDER